MALPYQIFVISHSPALVGLLGAFELGPLIAVSLVGGAIADRRDRRPVLVAAQIGVFVVALALAPTTLLGRPPAGGRAARARRAAGRLRRARPGRALGDHPGAARPERVCVPGIAFNYGMSQVTGIVGPALGGMLIELSALAAPTLFDAVQLLAR